MDINKMRNIVILKDLPSNLVDEAFVVLKNNQKIKKLEYADNKFDNFSCNEGIDNKDEYVVKEAELLISDYINKLENQSLTGENQKNHIMKKYKRLKIISAFLVVGFIVSLFIR